MASVGMAPFICAGQKAVTTAGTRVQLTSDSDHQNIHTVYIKAESGNTGVIYVGDSLVSSSRYLEELNPGESVSISVPSPPGGAAIGNTDATKIYLDSATNGDAVQWSFN